MTVTDPKSPLTREVQLADLHRVHHAISLLLSCQKVGELYAVAARLVLETSDLHRAVVLTVRDGELSARDSDALEDPESDLLRREILAAPIELAHGTREGRLVLLGYDPERQTPAPSVFDTVPGMGHVAVGTVAPEGPALGFLVADRHDRPADNVDRGVVKMVSIVLGVALERLALRARVAEVAGELRHLAVSSQALMSEVLAAPLSVPQDDGGRPVFGQANTELRPPHDPVRALLTEREIEVVSLLCTGATNKEIAAKLMLSPQTVKDYVARVCRKLQASNRAEAASRYMRLLQ